MSESYLRVTKRRKRLVFPTADAPSMHTFFCSMDFAGSVYRSGGPKSDFEGNAAVDAPSVFRVFGPHRLGRGDAARPQARGLHASAPKRAENLIGALPAQRNVCGLDAGAVRVADDFNRDRSPEVVGFDEQALDILPNLREGCFLAA